MAELKKAKYLRHLRVNKNRKVLKLIPQTITENRASKLSAYPSAKKNSKYAERFFLRN